MNASMHLPPDLVTLADYERHAMRLLDPAVWAYLDGASADGVTKAANRTAFDALKLESRVLADLSGFDTRTHVLGTDLDWPVLLAPVALQRLAHPEGEIAAVRGAGAAKTAMTVSTQASMLIEDIAASAETPLWFQLYLQPDRARTLDLVRRAEAAGCRALVVTVDAPINGIRADEARAGFAVPKDISAVNLAPSPARGLRDLITAAAGWSDIEWLRDRTGLPLVLKGITHPDDAAQAAQIGVDAIAVSNHGGRALDTMPASVEVLPRIAERIEGRMPILLDGGVRRGTDVVKALALGADAVMIGRPLAHALAVGGALGVAHMLTLLRAEFEAAMALCGCATPAAVNRSVLFSAA